SLSGRLNVVTEQPTVRTTDHEPRETVSLDRNTERPARREVKNGAVHADLEASFAARNPATVQPSAVSRARNRSDMSSWVGLLTGAFAKSQRINVRPMRFSRHPMQRISNCQGLR